MKRFAMFALFAGAMLLSGSGCATPGYTASEDWRHIVRNANYDLRQATDDVNYLLLVDEPSHLTVWNVQ